MTGPVRMEVSAAGHTGHVFASRGPGGRSAAPVVLIHGIGASHRYLRRLHRLLAGSTDTYSIDLPGFGATPRPGARSRSPTTPATSLAPWNSLAWPNSCSSGTRWEHSLPLEAALQEPGRIQYLVLMGPVVDPKRGTVAQQALALGRDALFYESASRIVVVFTDCLRCGPTWYFKTLRVMMEYPLAQRITGVTAEVLVIRGANDPVADADWSRRLAGLARRGQLMEVQGTGHAVQHAGALEVRDAILAFAGRRAAAGEALPGTRANEGRRERRVSGTSALGSDLEMSPGGALAE